MSLFDIYRAKKLGAGAGSLFDAKAGGKLNKDAWKKGFNKWDEEWVNGLYVDGVLNPAFSSYVASKNMFPILPDTKYFFHIGSIASSARTFVYYDEDKNYISDSVTKYVDTVITTPSNARYAHFSLGGAYGETYQNDICINISGEHDGEYVPYNG